MAIHRSDIAKGVKPIGRPQTAGAVHVQKATFVMSSSITAATDKIELAVLPPFATLVDAILIPEGTLTDLTAEIGFMSGKVGSVDNTRTVGKELWDGIELDEGTKRLSAAGAFFITPVDYPRSIGVKLSADVTGAASKKLSLILLYAQG